MPAPAAVLTGLGSWLPTKVLDNHEIAARLDTSDEWIRTRTGIRERRVAGPGESTVDLAVEAGGARKRLSEHPADRFVAMQGTAVFRHACARMAESSRTVLDRAGWMVGDVDRFVGHQANIRILQATAKQLGMPADAVVANIDRVGNTSAASIPLALDRLLETGGVHRGDQVLLLGFGAGLTAAGQVVRCP